MRQEERVALTRTVDAEDVYALGNFVLAVFCRHGVTGYISKFRDPSLIMSN